MNIIRDLHPIIVDAQQNANLKRTLQAVSRLFFNHCAAQRIAFALWDKIANAFVCQFVFNADRTGKPELENWEIRYDPRFDDPNAWVKFPHLPDGDRDPLLDPLPGHWLTSLPPVLVPLQIQQHPVALILLQGTDELREPDALNRDLLNVYLASLLDNHRLRSESLQKTASLATIYEMYKRTDMILTPEDVIGSLTEAVGTLVKFDTCLLFIADSKTGRLVPRRTIGNLDSAAELIDNPDDTPIGQVFQQKDPMLFHHLKMKSCMCVPIRHEDVVVGVLFLGTKRTYAYGSSDLISVGILASHFASLDRMISTLIQMKSYTRSFLDAMKDGLIVIENGGGITHINQPAIDFLHLPADTEGASCRTALQDHPLLLSRVEDVLTHGDRVDHEPLPDPVSDRTLEYTLFPFLDSEGIRLGCALLLADITERREMENILRRTDRLRSLGEMTASIAHEIRNPLTGIKMVAQIIEEDEALISAPHLLEHTRRQIREVERLDRLITEMLSFARPAPPRLAAGELSEIVETTVFMLADRAREKNLFIEQDLTTPLTVTCDEEQIRQVLINILINAMEAGPVNSTIRISTGWEDNEPVISVEDAGEGIRPEILTRIFNPFFTTKEKGTGLGLAVAYRIIEEHGGRIDISSLTGCGTLCRIILPGVEPDHL